LRSWHAIYRRRLPSRYLLLSGSAPSSFLNQIAPQAPPDDRRSSDKLQIWDTPSIRNIYSTMIPRVQFAKEQLFVNRGIPIKHCCLGKNSRPTANPKILTRRPPEHRVGKFQDSVSQSTAGSACEKYKLVRVSQT
jgi:hypothetical protein